MSANEIVKIEKGLYNKISAFFIGFVAPFDALSFIFNKKGVKRFFIVPFFLNIIVLSFLIYFSYVYLHPLLREQIPTGDAWYFIFLRFLLSTLLLLILAFISVFLYAIIGSLICAPFHDPLSAKVEKILQIELKESDISFKMMLADIVRIMKNIFKLILIVGGFNLLIFIINFIPPLGSILYAILSFLSLAFFFGFQFFDFPLERRRLSFNSKLKIIFSYKWMTFGVGTAFFLLSLIPIIGFLSITLGTVAGTKLFVEKIKGNVTVTVDEKNILL